MESSRERNHPRDEQDDTTVLRVIRRSVPAHRARGERAIRKIYFLRGNAILGSKPE